MGRFRRACGAPSRRGGNACLPCHADHVRRSRIKKQNEQAAKFKALEREVARLRRQAEVRR